MTTSNPSPSSAAASRAIRAQELRSKRRHHHHHHDNNDSHRGESGGGEESILELTPTTTIATILLLLAVGASIATSYIIIHQPNCLNFGGELNANLKDSEEPRLRNNAVIGVDSSSSSTNSATTDILTPMKVVSVAQEDTTMPPTCTSEQVEIIKKQLKPDGCNQGRPWYQSCSWTIATKGCQDPYWMFEFYATKYQLPSDKPFVAIFVNWPLREQKGQYIPTTLLVGSHNPSKYNVENFIDRANPGYSTKCKRKSISVTSTTGTPSTPTKVYVLESDSEKLDDLISISKEWNLETELIIESKDFTNPKSTTNTLDTWTKQRLPSSDNNIEDDNPIHYLSIQTDGYDYEILMGASDMLNRVRYLDFEVNWKGEWSNGSLTILIRKLKSRGFVCYFANSEDLWRITDCWISHYGTKHWGRIACGNAHHQDTKEILDTMEKIFIETLKKSISY